MMINGKFTNGGQIPAHGNEKKSDELIDELSAKNRKMRRALNRFAALNENAKEFRCIAGLILNAREIVSR